MVYGCQTCLKLIENPSDAKYFTSKCEPDGGLLMDKLTDCVPELLLDSVQDAALCRSCVSSLTSAYNFRQQTLETQQKIFGYLQQMPIDTQHDVGKIASYYNRLEIVTDKTETDKLKLDQENNSDISASTKIKHTCVLCLYSCVDKCMLRQHMILHTTENAPYNCDECSFIFPTTELLLDHLAAHTNEKPYSCNLCEYLTDCHGKLKEHCGMHRYPFQCNQCWLRFYDESMLQNHMKSEHNAQYQLILKCDLCRYMCGSTEKIEAHMNNNHKKYSCTFCSIDFISNSKLTKHMMAHRKMKTCVVQKKQIQKDEVLKSNEITHVSDGMDVDVRASETDCVNATNQTVDTPENDNSPKSYVCKLCKLEFPTCSELKMHLQVHYTVHVKDESSTDAKIAVTHTDLKAVRKIQTEIRYTLKSGSTAVPVETSSSKKRKRGKPRRFTKVFLGSNKFIRIKLKEAIEMGLM